MRSSGLADKSRVWPLALSRDNQVLVLIRGPEPSSPIDLALVSAEDGSIIRRAAPASSLAVANADGSRVVCAKLTDQWEGFEVWDGHTLERKATHEMNPQISSIANQRSRDGSLLFFHEYMVQPIIVYSTESGRPLGLIGPQLGGVEVFGLSNDGRSLAAVIGKWVDGTLVPDQLAVYDITTIRKPE